MTGESKGDTEKWIKEQNAKFGYGYSNDMMRKLEITGLPTAMLVSPAGEILYRGSPGGINDALVEKHIGGALAVPAWDWPKEASSAKKALQKNDFAKAISLAEGLEQDGVENGGAILQAIKALAAGRAAAIKAAADRGDFFTVTEMSKALKKALKGLPEMEQVDAAIAASKTSSAKKVIKAQKNIRKILDDIAGSNSRKKVEEAVKSLEKIVKKHDGDYAGTEATKHLENLKGMLERMR